MSKTAKIETLIADRNLFKGKYRSMAALMERARSQIRQISDHTEDEGDRAYFGSTNHADWLQDLAEEMEAWVIDFELPKGDINKMERDPYAEIREQRARAEKAEAAISQLHNFLGKMQGVCMGVAMSGRDHPNPDGALMELFNEAQAILFPPAVKADPACCGRPIHDGDPEGYVLACCGNVTSNAKGGGHE